MDTVKLVQKPTESDPYYIWEIPKGHYFKGINTVRFFPQVINLYLKEISDKELALLLDNNHSLRVQTSSTDTTSRIAITNLDIGGFRDPEYQKLLRSCPFNQIPCIIYLGPFWHYLGVNRLMCQRRDIGIGFAIPGIGYSMGMQMYGRDSYPGETEEKITEVEEVDDIFVIRKQY